LDVSFYSIVYLFTCIHLDKLNRIMCHNLLVDLSLVCIHLIWSWKWSCFIVCKSMSLGAGIIFAQEINQERAGTTFRNHVCFLTTKIRSWNSRRLHIYLCLRYTKNLRELISCRAQNPYNRLATIVGNALYVIFFFLYVFSF